MKRWFRFFGQTTIKVRLVTVLVTLLTLVQLVTIGSVSAFLTTLQDQRDIELLKDAVVRINASSHDPAPTATRQWLTSQGVRAWVTDGAGRVVTALGIDHGAPPTHTFTPSEPHLEGYEPRQQLVAVDRFAAGTTEPVQYVVVSVDPFLTHAEVRLTVNALWMVLPLTLILVGFVGFIMTRQALGPIEVINDTAERISGRDQGRRIPVGPSRDEVSRLATNINTMLDRIEASFARERRFNDDVAHELRTPLATLKTSLSLARSKPRDAETLVTMMAAMEADVDRMSQLVVRMLELGRGIAEPGQTASVAAVAARCLERFGPPAADAGVTLAAGPFNAAAAIDEPALQQVIDNLVENALRHTPRGGRVVVSQASPPNPGTAVVQVVDTGCGIPADHVDHVFERFYRVDRSRSRQTGGFGLGLSIVRTIVEAYGGQVTLRSQESVGTQVTVELPVARETNG
jgi:signal transduction histidine kinase